MSPSNEYIFVTHWKMAGSIERVYQILDDVESLPRWWPEVYLEVRVIAPGDERGIGKRVELWTRGWLPYTLRWSFTVLGKERPVHLRLAAEGDFVGLGEWTLRQSGEMAEITYDWRIRAEKPLLRRWSRLLKPIFAWNHRWAMARGEEGLRRELARLDRQAESP